MGLACTLMTDINTIDDLNAHPAFAGLVSQFHKSVMGFPSASTISNVPYLLVKVKSDDLTHLASALGLIFEPLGMDKASHRLEWRKLPEVLFDDDKTQWLVCRVAAVPLFSTDSNINDIEQTIQWTDQTQHLQGLYCINETCVVASVAKNMVGEDILAKINLASGKEIIAHIWSEEWPRKERQADTDALFVAHGRDVAALRLKHPPIDPLKWGLA